MVDLKVDWDSTRTRKRCDLTRRSMSRPVGSGLAGGDERTDEVSLAQSASGMTIATAGAKSEESAVRWKGSGRWERRQGASNSAMAGGRTSSS